MADAPKVDPKDAKIAVLEAALAAASAKPGAQNARGNEPLAEAHKGTKTYVVGPGKHYRNGKMFQAGERITVTDERPAKDWVLADDAPKAPKAAAPIAPVGRASDKNVGG